MPTFLEYLEGDLGPARRHIARLKAGILPPSPAVLDEIEASLDRCVARMQASSPTEVIKALEQYLDWHGSIHDEDCPEDDTCDCSWKPVNDGVNVALTHLREAAKPVIPRRADGPCG